MTRFDTDYDGEQPFGARLVSEPWFASLRQRADELKALQTGWDSYKAQPLDHATVDKAVELAIALAGSFPACAPQLVPTSEGEVQVEWHAEGWDIEMLVARAAISQAQADD